MRRSLTRALLAAAAASLGVCGAAGTVSAQSQRTRNVLAINWGAEDFPGSLEVNAAIRDAMTSDPNVPIAYSVEHLETERFPRDDATIALRDTIRRKYHSRPIDLVIAIADPALQFALEYRDELFPGVPIVYSGLAVLDTVDRGESGGVTGVLRTVAYTETLKLALVQHPSTEQVFVIADTVQSEIFETVQAALGEVTPKPRLVYLEADTVPALLAEVRAIPPRSLALYISFRPDDPEIATGIVEVARLVAEASPAPVYGTNERYLGSGIVGGVVRSADETAARMGQMGLQILKGARAGEIPIEDAQLAPVFDARALQRWGISEHLLPAGSRVSFHQPSLWQEYPRTVLSAVSAVLIQFGLILGLLYQRRAKRQAELQNRRQLAMTAHVERQLAMGTLTASIAHELNQPLGSILHNAQAAERLLATNRASPDQLREILGDIRSEDLRASQIIQRQRSMLKKRDFEQRPVDLNVVVRETLAIVGHDAATRDVRLDADLCDAPCAIIGDQILMQQVVLNLVLNAMDAMTQTPAGQRRVVVRTAKTRAGAEVAVRDYGAGIAPEIGARLFEPFVTTKAAGMGIGLAIVRGIVETHGGTIEARENPDGGATFRFTVPTVDAA
jgi:signal transduction histidine kinase